MWWTRLARSQYSLARTARAALTVTQWVCAWHLFAEYIGGPRILSGPSMLPTFNYTNDLVIENCLSCRRSPPRIARGDIVTLLSPIEPDRTICKRVIGLPGDTICVDPSLLWRGDDDSDYTPMGGPWGPTHVLVPPGHIWVAGDNISESRDSRNYGPVPLGLVRGKIIARIYPNPRWFTNPIKYID